MSRAPHPARSLEFLSRLHDGELSPAERAHFESHRAHCAECRRAAAEFEEALASYRIAGTAAPPKDLAARILRRLESASPRRRPFGVFFGIDPKWAGAFTAAIIAVLIGSAVAARRERPRHVAVTFATPVSPPAAPAPAGATAAAREARPASVGVPSPDVAERDAVALPKEEARANVPSPAAPAPERVAAARPSPAAAPEDDRIARSRAADPTPDPAMLRKDADARDLQDRSVAATAPAAAERLAVTATALDGGGAAPEVLNAADVPLSAADRGEWVVVVGADGVPQEIARGEREKKKNSREAAKTSAVRQEETAGAALRRIRFAPGPGPRRLLLRVE